MARSALVRAVRTDLYRLHDRWMSVLFPSEYGRAHPVLGQWRPETSAGRIAFLLWAAVGAVAVGLAYPLALVGFAARFYARRVDRTAAALGAAGVALLTSLAWGALTAVAYFRDFSRAGLVAVAAAGGIATVSAVLATTFARRGSRVTTVALGYPFGVTAFFLPPVVAALYSPALADLVFPASDLLAVWLLDNVLAVGGAATALRTAFDLVGVAYAGMWFGIAVPLGWALGLVVTFADLVRPAPDEASAAD